MENSLGLFQAMLLEGLSYRLGNNSFYAKKSTILDTTTTNEAVNSALPCLISGLLICSQNSI